MRYLLILMLLGCETTKPIPYKSDDAFKPSGLSNSLEYPVLIKDKICADMHGQPGLCSLRLKSNESLELKLLPQLYSYRLQIDCSKLIGFNKSFDIPKNSPTSITIGFKEIDNLKSFICIGEIIPLDRQEVSSKFEVRVKIVQENYTSREKMHIIVKDKKNYLVLGKHAKYSTVFLDGELHYFEEKTEIELKSPDSVFAFSESQNGRFNYYWGR